jgi:hypothetical protein
VLLAHMLVEPTYENWVDVLGTLQQCLGDGHAAAIDLIGAQER